MHNYSKTYATITPFTPSVSCALTRSGRVAPYVAAERSNRFTAELINHYDMRLTTDSTLFHIAPADMKTKHFLCCLIIRIYPTTNFSSKNNYPRRLYITRTLFYCLSSDLLFNRFFLNSNAFYSLKTYLWLLKTFIARNGILTFFRPQINCFLSWCYFIHNLWRSLIAFIFARSAASLRAEAVSSCPRQHAVTFYT